MEAPEETSMISKENKDPAVVVRAFNINAHETKAGESLLVLGQPGLHSETLSEKPF